MAANVESAKEDCVVVVVVADCESFVAINDSVIPVGHTFPVFIIKFCLFVACPCFSCAIPIHSVAPGILIKETPPAEIFTLAPGLRINTTHVSKLPSPSVSCCCCSHPLTKHVLCVLLSPSSLVEGGSEAIVFCICRYLINTTENTNYHFGHIPHKLSSSYST